VVQQTYKVCPQAVVSGSQAGSRHSTQVGASFSGLLDDSEDGSEAGSEAG